MTAWIAYLDTQACSKVAADNNNYNNYVLVQAIYDGSLCSSVFGQANVTAPLQVGVAASTTIASQDILIQGLIGRFADIHGETCRKYGIFIACITTYGTCSGFAWCGANSKDELMSAVTSACNCNRDDSCIVTVHRVPLTAVGVLGSAINTSLPRYYVGSSSILDLLVAATLCARTCLVSDMHNILGFH